VNRELSDLGEVKKRMRGVRRNDSVGLFWAVRPPSELYVECIPPTAALNSVRRKPLRQRIRTLIPANVRFDTRETRVCRDSEGKSFRMLLLGHAEERPDVERQPLENLKSDAARQAFAGEAGNKRRSESVVRIPPAVIDAVEGNDEIPERLARSGNDVRLI
jgi:hypothetical protein